MICDLAGLWTTSDADGGASVMGEVRVLSEPLEEAKTKGGWSKGRNEPGWGAPW